MLLRPQRGLKLWPFSTEKSPNEPFDIKINGLTVSSVIRPQLTEFCSKFSLNSALFSSCYGIFFLGIIQNLEDLRGGAIGSVESAGGNCDPGSWFRMMSRGTAKFHETRLGSIKNVLKI